MPYELPRPFSTDTFEPPALPARHLLPRPRLLDLLDGALEHPLTVVNAPAGCGKTVAVATWVARRKVRASWVRLDAADASTARLLAHLSAAVDHLTGARDVAPSQESGPTSQDPFAWKGPLYLSDPVAAEPVPPARDDAFSLLDGLLARMSALEEPAVLVLDGWHEASQAPRARLYVDWLARRLPAHAHLVLISRVFPQVGAARMRLQGDVCEVGEQALSFTRLEAAAFCQMEGLDLPDAQVDEAMAATEGWPMALRLVASAHEAIGRPGELSPELWRVFDRMLFDYVDDELLSHMPEALRSFASAAAELDEFNDALMAHVLQWGIDEADRCLDALFGYALADFTRTDAEGRACYRMPAVIRRALRGRAAGGAGHRRKTVLTRAGAWHEARGDWDRAVACFAAASGHDDVAQVIHRRWRSLFADDDLARVLAWIGLLPKDYVERRPKLCIVSALPLTAEGRQQDAMMRLRLAEASLRPDDDEVRGLYHAIRALCLAHFDAPAAAAEAQVGLDALAEDEDYLRAMLIQVLESHNAFADPVQAQRGYGSAARQLLGTGLRNPLCSAYANLSFLCALAGNTGAARDAADRAMGLYAPDEHAERPMLVVAYASRAFCSYAQGDLPAAWEDVRFGLAHAAGIRLDSALACLHALDALRARAEGDRSSELAAAEEALRASALWTLRSFVPVTALRDWLDAGVCSPQALYAALDAAPAAPVTDVLRASVAAAAGEGTSPVAALAVAFEGFPLARIRADVLVCAGAPADDQTQPALAAAFDAAAPEFLARPFIDDVALIEQPWRALAKDSRDSYAARVLRDLPAPAPAGTAEQLRGMLSDRELEVIRLAAQGLNTQQVADRLFVSRETAKKHLANVYAKLDVHTRTQAIATLRQAGLL